MQKLWKAEALHWKTKKVKTLWLIYNMQGAALIVYMEALGEVLSGAPLSVNE